MKKLLIPVFTILLVIMLAFTKGGDEIKTIVIGEELPSSEVKLEATDGQSYNFQELKKENGLLVIFTCNTCPFVVGGKDSDGWEGRYNEMYEAAVANKLGMVLVNSNAAKREDGDSMSDMTKHAKKSKLKATYVLDAGSVVADSFGARTTPHVFLFDEDNELVYAGAIDDNVGKSADVKEPWLKNALTQIGKGERVDPAQTRQKGCSIKRVKTE
ncbi:MAG: redoxin family protein [Flavobacteriales bacterium]|nr:redoxin family protein [Flavobacteriales bacterium]